MKKFLIPLILVCMFTIFCGCSSNVEEPYNRNHKLSYERKLRKAVFIPFMYEDKFYAYYALGKRLAGPDKDGVYKVQFLNGPREGEVLYTKNILVTTYASNGYDLQKGMVVLVNHWNPKKHDDNTRVDMWRKGVVNSLSELDKNKVMLEFPHDKNDFMATKEVFDLSNVRIITNPEVKDIRIFL